MNEIDRRKIATKRIKDADEEICPTCFAGCLDCFDAGKTHIEPWLLERLEVLEMAHVDAVEQGLGYVAQLYDALAEIERLKGVIDYIKSATPVWTGIGTTSSIVG